MMTLNGEELYVPYQVVDKAKFKGNVGYIISNSKKECRDRFAKHMGTGVEWKDLYKQGWRIVPCDIDACETDVYGKDCW